MKVKMESAMMTRTSNPEQILLTLNNLSVWVIQINPGAAEGKTYLVKYKEDDDKAYMKPEDIYTNIKKYMSITIGCVSFQFCLEFTLQGGGKSLFNGETIFNLNKFKDCSDNEDDMDEENNMNGAGNYGSQTASTETTLVQVDASALTSWKYGPDLMNMAADELEHLTAAHLCCTKVMAKPIKELEMKLGQLKLNGHYVQILDWPNSIDVDKHHAKLKHLTHHMMNIFPTQQITPYHFEIRICGKNDEYDICKYIGQQIRAPVTSKSDLLHKQILQFHTPPINDPNREGKILPFEDAQKLVEEGMALEDQLEFLPQGESNNAVANAMKKARKGDKEKKDIWKSNKVQMIMNFNEYGAPFCFYSKNAVGSHALPVVPTDEQWEAFQNEMENGY
eukprot:10853570-Ditylum_brightwellii.AAC.1